MSFKVIITRADGKRAVLTQKQLNLLPTLMRFTKQSELDATLIAACERHGIPVNFETQKDDGT